LLPAYFRNWLPSTQPKDADGVVMTNYGGSLGKQYSPTGVAQAALGYYDRWLVDSDPDRTKSDKAAFLAQIDWLLSHQSPDGLWLWSFKWGAQPVPWWSAMTEGVSMSALLRAYSMTGDPACLTAISLARSTFERAPNDHGVGASVVVGSKTYVVYQEYLKGYVANVLNGWIFSLVGLYETATYLHDQAASSDLLGPDRGIAALKVLLPYYDTGSWSFYYVTRPGGSGTRGLDTVRYHTLVIGQLIYMATISGDAFFSRYADRFQAYLDTCKAAGKCPPAS
jgi:hypothetical protein